MASGVKYPLLFRRMVLLSALHEFGGTAVEFGGTVRAPAPPPSGSPRCADVGGQAVTLYAPRGHEKVRAAIADLASGFLELAGQQKWRGSCPFASRAPRGHSWIDFDNGKGTGTPCASLVCVAFLETIAAAELSLLLSAGPAVFSPNPGQHYGVLWHDTLVRYQLTHKDGPNLGKSLGCSKPAMPPATGGVASGYRNGAADSNPCLPFALQATRCKCWLLHR